VRRVYQELTQSGFLSAEPRKHLMVTATLTKPGHVEALAQECSAKCDRLIDWAQEHNVSATSLARLFLRSATENENRKPAYTYVALTRAAAERFAREISKTWEIPVAPLTFADVVELSDAELASYAGILVNYFRHDGMLAALGGREARVFPVRVKLHERILRKIRRQGAGADVLLVVPKDDAPRVAAALLKFIARDVGHEVRLHTAAVDDVRDLADDVERGRYRLAVVSRHIWDDIPEKARRLPNVIPNENVLVMESLERVRVAAGILV